MSIKVEQVIGLRELLDRVETVEAILGLPQGCNGNPETCFQCSPDECALSENRLTELGSLVTTLLEEFRWHRALTTELEILQVIPEGTARRVDMRVRRERLVERLGDIARTASSIGGVQVMKESVHQRIEKLRDEIRELDAKLGDPR